MRRAYLTNNTTDRSIINIREVIDKIKKPLKHSIYGYLNKKHNYKIAKASLEETKIILINGDGTVLPITDDNLNYYFTGLTQFVDTISHHDNYLELMTNIISNVIDKTEDLYEKKAILNGFIFILNATNFYDQKDLVQHFLTNFDTELFLILTLVLIQMKTTPFRTF